MFLLIQAFYQHVIHVYFYILSYLQTKHMIDQPLIGCPRVLQSEGHYFEAKHALTGDEGCLLLIYLVHPYLVIT